MSIKRLGILAIKIFKSLNEINPLTLHIFRPKENHKVRHNDIMVKCINISRFSTQILRSENMKQSAIKCKIITSFPNSRGILKPGSDRNIHEI